MARPRQNRVIQQPPKVKGFNPLAYYSGSFKSISLKMEEYESIRLLDYESLTQVEAAVYMNISRPTLTRIYDSARKKVAQTIIEGNQLLIEGGDFVFTEQWYECRVCLSKFNNPKQTEIHSCSLCGEKNLVLIEND